MEYFDKINAHHSLYFGNLTEPEDNQICFTIHEAIEGNDIELLDFGSKSLKVKKIISSKDTSAYEILFKSYISYNIIDESYANPDKYKNYDGSIFRIYNKSYFLDFIYKSTFATESYPDPFKHYGFCCENHIINIVSVDSPEIKIIQNHFPEDRQSSYSRQKN